jgi:hypothetical protein
MRWLFVTLALAALLAAVAAAAPDSGTPPLVCYDRVGNIGELFGRQPADSLDDPTGTMRLVYDWRIGYAAMVGGGHLAGCDTFTVVGLPAGTLVDVRMRLHSIAHIDTSYVSWLAFDYELYWFTLGGVLESSWGVEAGDPPLDRDTYEEVVLHCFAGEPFPMRWRFDGGGFRAGHYFFMRGIWEALDLPPGARLVSVAGMGYDVTAARSSSWGRLKLHYR